MAACAARMFRHDLERAEIACQNSEGRHRDFHSLRHRFGAELAMASVPLPDVAQTLMRYSAVTQTPDRYIHVGLWDTAAALEKLPPVPSPAPPLEVVSGQVTETDKQPISERFAQYLPNGGDGKGRNVSDSNVTSVSELS